MQTQMACRIDSRHGPASNARNRSMDCQHKVEWQDRYQFDPLIFLGEDGRRKTMHATTMDEDLKREGYVQGAVLSTFSR
ncbi:hypothetical protein BaRGS_00001639 [Batillaria attramentaria]|uniref:Uncharacterized protein n=1 Tax=Batillaria attramentaria TaxID=370345 RepID=A0ABD0M7D2_9CAEN